MTEADTPRQATRTAIVEAAARLLRDGGPAAMTTRGVAEAAGVQAPTIYRQFGDKDGLLEAVAEHVMATFVAAKVDAAAAEAAADADPLEDLRRSWARQVDFGLANPAVFRLLGDPERVVDSPAARTGREVLAARVHRLAVVGRLAVPERQAVDLIQAAGVGVIQQLLATPVEDRDPTLAGEMFEAVLGRILGAAPPPAGAGPAAAAVHLRAVVSELDALSEPERRLLAEWLDRVLARPGPSSDGLGA
ncbi:TetR/AcrR family transcriptional regulator [Phycicoccus flavus]|uniref:TetR/AcrR family transcriptional regulator n=1 Tax=Phycicoccus flavus TaxID=2502783 RepID=UPI000FEB7F68|nr:TetR/AcrR family transcriptional regulator [Phycicoccus flavus]NHA66536.1 TetR/AcrR family transcriptional regulator [Phycicoccus flavus]